MNIHRQINALRLFALAGGPTKLRRLLITSRGGDPADPDAVPHIMTVTMWRSRERIAREWEIPVICAVMKNDPSLTFEDFLVDTPPPAEPELDPEINPGGLFSRTRAARL
jgi:hypothetical protein